MYKMQCFELSIHRQSLRLCSSCYGRFFQIEMSLVSLVLSLVLRACQPTGIGHQRIFNLDAFSQFMEL